MSKSNAEHVDLLEPCLRGDELAWEALVREHQGRIYGLAYHYTRNPEEARDLAQTIFVKVYRALNSCPSAEALLPWMLRVARNASIDYLRRRKVRPPTEDLPADRLQGLADSSATPEDLSIARSRKRILYRAMSTLTQLNREIILLREIHGLSLAEVASLLHVPLGTIKSRLHRARLELAEEVLALDSRAEEGVFAEGGGDG